MNEHVDRDTLAVLALGEPSEHAEVDTHVDRCDECRDTVSAFAHVRDVATAVEAADRSPPPPPPHLWEAIQRKLDGRGEEASASASAPASLATARSRRGRLTAALAAAAMLAIGVLAGTQVWQSPVPDVVADTELEPLTDVAAGTARLVRADGALHLEVDADLPAPDGFYALWMIDEEVAGMVSLGPLEPGRAYRLPDGFDPGAYPIVDVSIQPFDGDPTHSGNSVLRGQLPVGS
jgi:hypothetical protein